MKIEKEVFENIFEKAKIRYTELGNVDIKLKFSKGLFFTMRASFKLNSFFSQKRKYIIYINLNRRKDVLSKLSEDDLLAWFGHELAHVLDYETMSNFELLIFALKYIFNPEFRFSVEKRIHAFSCNNGFVMEVFGAWKKFMSLDSIDNKYKEYAKKCRPDWEDIQQVATTHGITREDFESYQ